MFDEMKKETREKIIKKNHSLKFDLFFLSEMEIILCGQRKLKCLISEFFTTDNRIVYTYLKYLGFLNLLVAKLLIVHMS